MAVLFDSFSYRIKEVESGICYDRWHFGKYPELTMPEHLYYLNRVINCLLTHDKIIIRTDSQAKRDPNEVWMAIKPLLGNMIMIKKVVSQF